jgi:2-keto-myo-inositol isomerase
MRLDQIAINSTTTRQPSLADAFDAYAEAGFRLVELELPEPKQLGAVEVGRLLTERGLRCTGGFDDELKCFAGPEALAASIEGIVASARFVDELGGGIVVFGTDGPPEPGPAHPAPLAPIVAGAQQALAAIDGLDATLALEFNWSPVVRSLQSAVAIADAVDSPRLGVLFDAAHWYTTPTKLEHLTPHAVSRIVQVHLDDMPDIPADRADCNDDRVMPGEGTLPLREMIERIDAGGYTGTYVLELFSEDIWTMPAREAARRGYASMAALAS